MDLRYVVSVETCFPYLDRNCMLDFGCGQGPSRKSYPLENLLGKFPLVVVLAVYSLHDFTIRSIICIASSRELLKGVPDSLGRLLASERLKMQMCEQKPREAIRIYNSFKWFFFYPLTFLGQPQRLQ